MIGFVDIETTGLNPQRCKILEIAIVLTTDDLEEVAKQEWLVKQPEFILDTMGEWCSETHTETGLLEEVRQSGQSREQVIEEVTSFLKEHFPDDEQVPMGGNSVHFDRAFLKHHMPEVEALFHYRNIDVSIFRSLLNRWDQEESLFVEDEDEDESGVLHRGMDDIQRCIRSLRHYRSLLTN